MNSEEEKTSHLQEATLTTSGTGTNKCFSKNAQEHGAPKRVHVLLDSSKGTSFLKEHVGDSRGATSVVFSPVSGGGKPNLSLSAYIHIKKGFKAVYLEDSASTNFCDRELIFCSSQGRKNTIFVTCLIFNKQ